MTRTSILLLTTAMAACSKGSDSSPPIPPSASPPRSAIAKASPATSAAPSPATPSTVAWSGHYTAGPGPFYVPDGGEWSGVRFRGEDASVGLGGGTLVATVDPEGHLLGTLDGPLGPGRLTGEVGKTKAFSAWIVPSTPGQGFTGTAVGSEEGDRISGTMKLSLPTGNVIREAAFTLDRKR